MRKFFTSLRIDLSTTSATVTYPTPGRETEPSVLAACGLSEKSPAAAAAALGRALDEAGLSRCSAVIVLADDWARIFMVTPPKNTERMRDCHAAVALRFQVLYGEPLGDWLVQADWNASRPFLACALPKVLSDALLHSCAEHGVKVVSTVPSFIRAWNRWHRQLGESTWFGIVHAGSLTLAAVDGGRLAEIRRLSVPPQGLQRQTWLNDQVSREALRLGLSMPRGLHLCGDVPEAWLANGDGPGIECRRLDAPAADEPAGARSSAALANHEA